MPEVGETAPALAGQPVFGVPFDLVRAGGRGVVLIAFVRPPGSPHAQKAIGRLHSLWAEIDAAGGAIVVVTSGSLESVRDWVPREHILVPVLHDERGELHAAWGVGRDAAWRTLARGAGPIRGLVSALRPGKALIRPEDDYLPAEFVVRNDRVTYAAVGRSVLHLPDTNALRQAAQA